LLFSKQFSIVGETKNTVIKIIIASIVGGIIMFVWQFMSWGALDFHRSSQEYTPNQDEIISFLNTKFDKDGGYFLPNSPEGTSSEDMEAQMKDSMGKPWVQIYYHKEMNMSMGMNMFRGLAVDIFTFFLLAWILSKISGNTFGTTVMVSLATGLMCFFNTQYVNHIWYETFDVNASFVDAIVSWGLVGAWLGWWLNRK